MNALFKSIKMDSWDKAMTNDQKKKLCWSLVSKAYIEKYNYDTFIYLALDFC